MVYFFVLIVKIIIRIFAVYQMILQILVVAKDQILNLGCHSWINEVFFDFCELGQLFFDDLRRVKVIFVAFRFSFFAAGARKVYFSLAGKGIYDPELPGFPTFILGRILIRGIRIWSQVDN